MYIRIFMYILISARGLRASSTTGGAAGTPAPTILNPRGGGSRLVAVCTRSMTHPGAGHSPQFPPPAPAGLSRLDLSMNDVSDVPVFHANSMIET